MEEEQFVRTFMGV